MTLRPVQIGQMILNVSRAYALGVQRDNLVLNAGYVRMMLLHDHRFELTVAISGMIHSGYYITFGWEG